MLGTCYAIVSFLDFGQFSAIQKPASGCMVKVLLSKGTIFAKKCWLFNKKNPDISKIKGVLVLKGTFCETK